jgi:two-component system chemotaxis sensor kinase CheA
LGDTSKYLPLFVREATEHADQLDRHLPALLSAKVEPDLVQEIHRHVHSLRGMAAAMGFEEITDLARSAERLLQRLLERRVPLETATGRRLSEAKSLLQVMILARATGSVAASDPQLVAEIERAASP